MDDGELHLRIAPDAVLERLKKALKQPAKRILGIKVADHYVGLVEGREFEVWERSRHAVHLRGRVAGERGGTVVRLESSLTRRARILLVVFFSVYVVAAYGFATRGGNPLPLSLAIGVGGLVMLVAYFYISFRLRRTGLRRFVRGVVEDVVAD